jgi:serine/threonine protein kinase
VLKGGSYTQAADVWGLGVLLFQMATLRLPFDSLDPEVIENSIEEMDHIDFPSFSFRFKALIDGMLKIDPAERLTVKQIVKDP